MLSSRALLKLNNSLANAVLAFEIEFKLAFVKVEISVLSNPRYDRMHTLYFNSDKLFLWINR